MPIHKRHFLQQTAGIEIRAAIGELIAKHQLTRGEATAILGEVIAERASYQIREERHGRRSIKGAIEE